MTLIQPDWPVAASTSAASPTHSVAVTGAPAATYVTRLTLADQLGSTGRYVLTRTQKEMTVPAGPRQAADMVTGAKGDEYMYA